MSKKTYICSEGKDKKRHNMRETQKIAKITEAEFLSNEERRLSELSGLIHLSGKSNSEIAQACNLDRRTVNAARKGKAVRADATERISYYIRSINRLKAWNNL